VTGFEDTFVMAAVFLVWCLVAGMLVPGRRRRSEAIRLESQLAANPE
jgi:hypothetical protein